MSKQRKFQLRSRICVHKSYCIPYTEHYILYTEHYILYMYNTPFHKNQILDIHIAQTWFLVLGSIETNVRKWVFPKYVSFPTNWTPPALHCMYNGEIGQKRYLVLTFDWKAALIPVGFVWGLSLLGLDCDGLYLGDREATWFPWQSESESQFFI